MRPEDTPFGRRTPTYGLSEHAVQLILEGGARAAAAYADQTLKAAEDALRYYVEEGGEPRQLRVARDAIARASAALELGFSGGD